MIATSIKHGDLMIDYDSAGWVQITRQSNMQTIQLSISEWAFLQATADLRGWPIAPPGDPQPDPRSA